jgi:hypothetical protein
MMRLRPIASPSGPLDVEANAISSTITDTDKPAVAGLMPNSLDSTGKIGCVKYISAKTTIAAAYNARIAFRDKTGTAEIDGRKRDVEGITIGSFTSATPLRQHTVSPFGAKGYIELMLHL